MQRHETLLTLVVAGGMHAALAAARTHGILVKFKEEIRIAPGEYETILLASNTGENQEKCFLWYCNSQMWKEAPIGTLLFYVLPRG